MKIAVALVVVCLALVLADDPTECDADKCDHLQCPAIKCAPGYISYVVNYPCACCPTCVVILGEGAKCGLPITTDTGKCDEGLKCYDGLCVQNVTTV